MLTQRRITLAVIAAWLAFDGLGWTAVPLKDIVSTIENSGFQGEFLTKKELEIAADIQSLGPGAIPYLLPLLQHENRGVRELAAYTLGGMDGLGTEHLDTLIESRHRGNKRILFAIARVGTPRAIALLFDELKREKSEHAPVTYAFATLGEKGVPHLLELIRREPFDPQLLRPIVLIFNRLKDKAESAVDPLTEFVASGRGDENATKCAVLALGEIGPKARASVPVLLKLAQDRPGPFKVTVDKALFTMGAPEAVARLLDRLKQEPDVRTLLGILCDIASLKENAKGAGPTLMRYLAHDDWDVRANAARAMGYIGYAEASPDLIQLLQTDYDWRLVYSSAESLGRLRVFDALPALNQIAQGHWYPPVCEAAKKAILVINGRAIYEVKHRKIQPEFPLEFREYELVGVPTYSSRKGPRGKEGPLYVEQEDALDKTQLDKIASQLQTASSDSDKTGGKTKKFATKLKYVPQAGIKVRDGYLLGSDYGEWGGELGYLDSRGTQTVLLDKQVQGIYMMTSGIVVVSGDLMWDEGNLYRVLRDADGAWQVRQWKVLPGWPGTSGMLANGNLFVGCEDGDIEVSPAGEIKMVTGSW